MMFFSAGFIRDVGKCTICDAPMRECDHIRGKIYFGQVCDEYGYSILEGDHVAIVDNPKDKRCYAKAFKSEGQWIDRLTRAKFVKAKNDSSKEESDFLVEGIMMTAHVPAGVFL